MVTELSGEFVRNNEEMLVAARRCIELGQIIPALVLMYSQIDALAWACAEHRGRSQVRANFLTWTETWLMPHLRPLIPTLNPIDIYAARCGVLHTLTSDSDLSVAGHAKDLGYARGTADAAGVNLKVATERPDVAARFVMVQLEWLHEAVSKALASLQRAAVADEALRELIERAGSRHFVRFPAHGSRRPID